MSEAAPLINKVLEDARAERERILKEALQQAEEIKKKAEEEYNKRVNALLEARLSIERARILSSALLERRRKLSLIRSAIVDAIAEAAWKKLSDTIEGKSGIDYYSVLYKLLKEACKKLSESEVIVAANERDLEWLSKNLHKIEIKLSEELAMPIKIKLYEEPLKIAGGVVVYSKDMRKYYVNTIEGRFKTAISKFRRTCAGILRGIMKEVGLEAI